MDESPVSLQARLISRLIRWFLGLVLATCKVRIIGHEHLQKAYKQGPALIYLWHNRLTLIGAMCLRASDHLKFCAFVSNSKDGEILAAYTQSYRRGSTIRVPHDSKDRALKALINRLKLKKDIPIVTPDGPKGPRYEMKPGILIAAKETGSALIPFTWRANKFFTLKTWDQLRIPLPFTTIEAVYGPALYLNPDQTAEEEIPRIKEALDSLN